MKRKKALILSLSLVALLMALGLAFAGCGSVERDMELAKEVAQAEIAGDISSFPEWEGVVVMDGQPYYNLDGDVICYYFALSKEGSVVGSIVVGSSLYDHAFFQLGSGAPPSIPTAKEVSSSVERDLGLKVPEKDIGEPLRLVYTEYRFYFAMYDIGGQVIGIDLLRKKAVLASDLEMGIASPE